MSEESVTDESAEPIADESVMDGPESDESDDPQVDGPVLLFDGVCNLCNGAVQFVIRHDPEGVFRFASLQSEVGSDLLTRCGTRAADSEDEGPETVVLIEGGRCFEKSDAALRVAGRIGLPYSTLSVFRVVPRPLRDAVYDFVAARRYRWFGRRDECMVPTPEHETRFLD